jgi:hypothetical protein
LPSLAIVEAMTAPTVVEVVVSAVVPVLVPVESVFEVIATVVVAAAAWANPLPMVAGDAPTDSAAVITADVMAAAALAPIVAMAVCITAAIFAAIVAWSPCPFATAWAICV